MSQRSHQSDYEHQRDLRGKAESSLAAGDTATASRLARELLDANRDQESWNYGNEIHAGNQILGLAALQDGDIEAAKEYLRAAGRTPGSPQLNSFGPTMTLAQALLGRGERDAVLDYLDDVEKFWVPVKSEGNYLLNFVRNHVNDSNRKKLEQWKEAIRTGEVPVLNRVSEPS
jgi:hypothetical protein